MLSQREIHSVLKSSIDEKDKEDRVSINVTNVQRDKRRPPPPTFILRGGENDISALEFLTFPYLASGTVSGRLKIWSFVNRRVVYEFSPHGNFGILELIFISRKNVENNSVEIVFSAKAVMVSLRHGCCL